jgi:hypothetical protein
MDSTLEQLARYVYQQLQQGVSEQNIRAALAQNRWTPDWIDAVFNVVHQNPNMFNAPAIQPLKRSENLKATTADPQSTPEISRSANPVFPTRPGRPNKSATKKKSNTKRKLLITAVLVVLLGLMTGTYFLMHQKDKAGNTQSTGSTTNTPANQDKKEEEKKLAKSPDEERKDDLNTLLSNLADYYVAHKMYPTYDALKSKAFADQNKDFDTTAFADPKWSADNLACTEGDKAILAAKPTPGCYAYGATSSDGAACDNQKVFCTRITVTATLDNGADYHIILDKNT